MRTKEQTYEMWAGKYWADHDNMDNLTDDKLKKAFECCVMKPSKEDYEGIKDSIRRWRIGYEHFEGFMVCEECIDDLGDIHELTVTSKRGKCVDCGKEINEVNNNNNNNITGGN